MDRHLFISTAVILLSFSAISQQIKVGLWQDGQLTKKAYYHSDQEVVWLVDDERTITIDANRTSYFTAEGKTIKLSIANRTYGRFKSIRLAESAEVFTLKRLEPEQVEEKYEQGIEIKPVDEGLLILNYISDFDSYVAGVTESEAGKEKGLEYYKVQAVISRTYALSNARKHEHEGFNLCDQVHCQVYHGIARFDEDIIEAARITSGQVLVDSDLNLITAAFHSNCGGHTVNSEHVWSKALPYLTSRIDTFCLNGNHAEWEAEILKSAWNDYLVEQDEFMLEENGGHALYSYAPESRGLKYPDAKRGLELKKLRHKWRLNSTYFHIADAGDMLRLSGKGFGHGVGLCQEGAMNMALIGYGYRDVLEFYYTGVHLVHLSVIDFFKDN